MGCTRQPAHPACVHRVYFNKTTDNAKDYLVDHSIIHYLIDPEGEFVTFYGGSGSRGEGGAQAFGARSREVEHFVERLRALLRLPCSAV